MSEKRIYVIIAETVQTALVKELSQDLPARDIVLPSMDTKTIVQPKGRIAAQCAHVVSQMRFNSDASVGRGIYTTIILSVPDSFQLQFRQFLLEQNGVTVYAFFDANEEYGQIGIKTAICTPLIEREEAGYALDYLNLWS